MFSNICLFRKFFKTFFKMKLALFILFGSFFVLIAADDLGPILYPPQALTVRVVGGVNATDGQAPFQCSMQLIFPVRIHLCGCAILSEKWIITAAHCLHYDPSLIEVLVGTNNLNSNSRTYYKIAKAIKHEKHDQPKFAYDIGLLQVSESIQFNEKVQPIKYSRDEVPHGAIAQLTGWGRLSADGAIPEWLQAINLTIVSTEKCKERLGSNVHDSHVCTFNKAGEGSCKGDSGGPLTFNGNLVGITNFGRPCAQGYPDAFAKISYLYDWIQQNTESN